MMDSTHSDWHADGKYVLKDSILFHTSTFHISIVHSPHLGLIYNPHGFPEPTSNLFQLPKSQLPHLPQSEMLFPPNLTPKLPKMPLENMEELGLKRLSWITGYDTDKTVSMFHVFTDLQANIGV
jgi:hypothetical protein